MPSIVRCTNASFEAVRALLLVQAARTGEVGKLLDVREFVVERFVTLVVKDRDSYAEKLDIFEIRFDRAVMMLRKDAFRKVSQRDNPMTPLEYDEGGRCPSGTSRKVSLFSTRG